MNNETYISLVYEDILSEAVLRKVIQESPREYNILHNFNKNGKTKIDKTLKKYNQASRIYPFLVLRDLDTDHDCAPELVKKLIDFTPSKNFLFHIAVREIDSWLLADRASVSRFLGVRMGDVPSPPDEIVNPKEMLISLARKSRFRNIRESIPPLPKSTAKQGPGYNIELTFFIKNHWNTKNAAKNSPSLARLIRRLEIFSPEPPA